MTRRSFFFVASTLTYLLALTMASASGGDAPEARSVAAPEAVGAQTAPQAPAAGYVGSDTCVACHEDQQHGYDAGPHGKAANPRAPAAQHGCESCHGPGEKHIDYTGMDIPEGGTAVPYWMEDPQVKKDWEAMIAQNGVSSRMLKEFYDKNFKGELPKGV